MAKVIKGKQIKKTKADGIFPFEKENYQIIGVGLLFIIAGYIAMLGNVVEGFSQLTLSPILLLIGYCVIIPIGIVYRKKEKPPTSEPTPPPQACERDDAPSTRKMVAPCLRYFTPFGDFELPEPRRTAPGRGEAGQPASGFIAAGEQPV